MTVQIAYVRTVRWGFMRLCEISEGRIADRAGMPQVICYGILKADAVSLGRHPG